MALQLRTTCLTATLLSLFGVFGCSSAVEPSTPPSLRVMNPLCDASGCRSLQIRAFIWKFTVPQPPTGLKVVGVVTGPSACLSFPPSWALVVTGVPSAGAAVKSDTLTWTPDDAVFLAAVDSADFELLSTTETFVPGEAKGWDLTFSGATAPGSLPLQAHLSPSEGCTQY